MLYINRQGDALKPISFGHCSFFLWSYFRMGQQVSAYRKWNLLVATVTPQVVMRMLSQLCSMMTGWWILQFQKSHHQSGWELKTATSTIGVVWRCNTVMIRSWAIHHCFPMQIQLSKVGLNVKLLTHYQTTNLDFSKLKEFADDNFRFDENCRKLSKWVENTGGKGEIARSEQFLLFPQCFQKACFPGASKGVLWEWVNSKMWNQNFLLFIRPSKTGRIMGSPVAGWRAGVRAGGVQFFVWSISPKLL